jgi:CDP-diacylglycerol--serine O-phosphatidyltransferase
MNKIKRAIPNTLTCLNLFSGCLACIYAFVGAFEYTFICILLSAFFDFFDGMVARLLHVVSPIGKELDSLADNISFGLVPAIIVMTMMGFGYSEYNSFLDEISSFIPLLAFLISVFSALRLAKFNIDPRQAHSFIGLPTPANTLFWISFALGAPQYFGRINILLLVAMVIVSCWLLVAEIPMFSLKFENLKWADNKVRFIFLIVCIPLFFLGKICLAAIILWYILLSLVTIKREEVKN